MKDKQTEKILENVKQKIAISNFEREVRYEKYKKKYV